jgi:hypothetical protein
MPSSTLVRQVVRHPECPPPARGLPNPHKGRLLPICCLRWVACLVGDASSGSAVGTCFTLLKSQSNRPARVPGALAAGGGAYQHRPARSLHYGDLYPEADTALRDRLDVLYGAARPTPEGTVVRLRGQAGRGPSVAPVGPRERRERRPMVARRRSDLLGCWVEVRGFEPLTSSVRDLHGAFAQGTAWC